MQEQPTELFAFRKKIKRYILKKAKKAIGTSISPIVVIIENEEKAKINEAIKPIFLSNSSFPIRYTKIIEKLPDKTEKNLNPRTPVPKNFINKSVRKNQIAS